MNPVITAFESSPDRGLGLARDMPVRWAFEETGQAYNVRLISFSEMKESAHLSLQPFGQIPTYEHDNLVLFESGAIVLHIAERYPGLLPDNPAARARAISWMFAAVSTLEPVIIQREAAILLESRETWHEKRLPLVEKRICQRLAPLSQVLDNRQWLEAEFSAGDLLMIQVLRRLKSSTILDRFPVLKSYVSSGEARSAFIRAFEAQKTVFENSLK